MKVLICSIALTLAICPVFAQEYDLVIRNGHVIDPKNGVDGRMDLAIDDGRVAEVRPDIPAHMARQIIDATGLYVSPGFIDLHTHVFAGSNPGFADGSNSIAPDDFSPRSGVTTVVDAGTSGWRNFGLFKKQIIDRSRTRVLAFISIGGLGLSSKAAQEDVNDMLADSAYAVAKRYPGTIVGIKIGHYEQKDWTPFRRAMEAAERANLPLLVECHLPEYPLEEQLAKMREGDIITHAFEQVAERMPVVGEDGKVRPYVLDASRRGVLFDVGHGGAGFWFSQAIPALRQGLAPNSFGTDLHRFSVNAGMKDFMNVMSKYMAMGMDLPGVVTRATWLPAKAIKREDLGHLTKGAVADVAVWGIRRGNFGFVDAGGNRIEGTGKLEAELTLREGRVVWDLNGRTAKAFEAD